MTYNTKLQELHANLDMVKEIIKTHKEAALAKLDEVITKYFLILPEARVTRRDVRPDMWHGIEFVFDIGFWNEAEERIDFGSDFWGSYEQYKNHKLGINYGTCGTFHHDDIYQIKRLQLLGQVANTWDTINEELDKVAESCKPYLEALDEMYKIEAEINSIKKEIVAARRAEVEKSLAIGVSLIYNEDIPTRERLFGTHDEPYYITKMTPKFVYLGLSPDTVPDMCYKVKKESLVSSLANNKINRIVENV